MNSGIGKFFPNIQRRTMIAFGLAIISGITLGILVVLTPALPLPSSMQKLVYVIPVALTTVILFNNPNRLILAAIALGVPLNLDFSVIISPYARNLENVSNGHRTIVALTEFRISLILVLVVIGYVLWLVERSKDMRPTIRFFSVTTIPALGLVLISIVSMIQAEDLQLSLFKIAQLIELLLLYFYIANHLRTKKDVQFFIMVLMWGMLAEGILMAVQYRTGLAFSVAGITAGVDPSDGRTTGTLGTSDTAGGVISAFLAIDFAMFWLLPKRWPRIFAGIVFLIGSIALITTGARMDWLSLVVAGFIFVIVGLKRGLVQTKTLVMILLLILVIGAAFFPFIYGRVTGDDQGSAASRPMMFRLAWNVINASTNHFFFGVGSNNYALIASEFNAANVGNLGYVIDSSVHNAYLLNWAEIGFIGLFIYIGFLASGLIRPWRQIRSSDRFISIIALGLECALIALCIQMMAYPFITRSILLFLWLTVGLIASLDNLEPDQGTLMIKRTAL